MVKESLFTQQQKQSAGEPRYRTSTSPTSFERNFCLTLDTYCSVRKESTKYVSSHVMFVTDRVCKSRGDNQVRRNT